MDPFDTLSDASSRLTSPASRSPTPPSELDRLYPSPPSSGQSSQDSSPAPDDMRTKRSRDDTDDSQPTKKRKMSEPKPRTTEHLDLQSKILKDSEKEQLDKLLKVLHKKRKIVVVAGAGISVSAGIPDFRSSTGLFKTLKGQHKLKSSGKDLFDASVYKDDKSTTQFHDMVRNLSEMSKAAQPTPFHHLLATLAADGRLLRLYSQNVDSLDIQIPPLSTQVPLQRKAPYPKTILLHGGLEKMVCSKCHALSDFDAQLFQGPLPPACSNCLEADDVRTNHAGKRSHGVGRLRPRMVLYNEHNPDDEAIGSVVKADLRTRPDALIVVGTTLKVPGVKRIVKEMCGVVRGRRDGATIWINKNPPPPGPGFEWDLIVNGPCDRVAELASMPNWDEKVEGEPVTIEDAEKICSVEGSQQHTTNEVVISTPAKPKTFDRIQGVMTPMSTPPFSPITIEKKPEIILDNINLATPTKAPVTGINFQNVKKAGVSKPVKMPKQKAIGTRKTGPRTKKAAVGNAKISASFKVSKTAAQVSMAKTKEQALPGISQFQTQYTPPAVHPVVEVQQPMQPVSPGAVRNNSSPPFNVAGVKSEKDESFHREVSAEWIAERLNSRPTTPVRPQSPEERKEIVTPPGYVSPSLKCLLNW